MPFSDIHDSNSSVRVSALRRRWRRREDGRYWAPSTVLAAIFFCFFGVVFASLAFDEARAGHYLTALAAACISALFFAIPVFGFRLRHRDAEIACPRVTMYEGRPAIHFPGDRLAIAVSATLYGLLAGAVLSAILSGWDGSPGGFIPFGVPALFFLSYTVFALLGRFDESGTVLDETGVTIRARGLRAQIPWSSIKGAEIVRHRPFPYPRVAIRLHPGTPREVSTTVPWWIGSPRPRRDTVYLTKVQIPGMITEVPSTTPVPFIRAFAQHPPSRKTLQELVDEPSSEPTITI